jgi:FLVCR family MFS transporter 7
MNNSEASFEVYSRRWAVLVIFVLSGFANALVLLSWSPISDKASDFWGGISTTAVNSLAVSFQVMYIPGTILATNAMKKSDLRTTMLLGGSLTTVGCVIRWVGVFARENGNMSPVLSYVIVLLGTLMVASSQPFYLNMPAKIAGSWFAVQERDVGTTLCSLANPLGSAVGSIIPAIFVSGGGDDDTGDVKGVGTLMLVQLIVAVLALILVFFFFSSAPPTPPSNSAMQMSNKNDGDQQTAVWDDVKALVAHKDYFKLLVGFTIGLGNLNALAALLNQLPGDYSNSEVGNLGAILIMCGFIGAFLSGFVLESTKAYRPILKMVYTISFGAWVFFASNCRKDNYGLLLASAGLLGFTLLPIIPSTIMNAVECVFPLSEDIALGLLYASANTMAIFMTFIGQMLLSWDSFGPAPLFPYGVWIIGTMFLGLLPTLMFNGQYVRNEQDAQKPLLSETI